MRVWFYWNVSYKHHYTNQINKELKKLTFSELYLTCRKSKTLGCEVAYCFLLFMLDIVLLLVVKK